MSDSIARDCVRTGVRAGSWQDAIRRAAAPLVERGSIEGGYVERMISSVVELGPYIVLMPGFALAHAAPGDDVHASDLSVALFDDEVFFGSANDPVRVVMCLACVDRESHIARLQAVAEKLLDDTFVARMIACSSDQELYELVNA
ncbi:MAG TPA: PTS sugar transporter subunit IIA [Candidatus Olsenella stercoravium]|uniref:Ascorbate-specific PTS system EIIA component n=1 Tax=Candidatus Olsenella stercoravium TaxID=2838713 RepID=A0A9D2DKG7_9ACTN|nr:PTS sugar transporter subunit IIA [Candidatus Olsenella stercoravium]